jgi:hypothetical protein
MQWKSFVCRRGDSRARSNCDALFAPGLYSLIACILVLTAIISLPLGARSSLIGIAGHVVVSSPLVVPSFEAPDSLLEVTYGVQP